MASEVSSVPVNGNYAPHQGYGGIEQQNNFAYNNNASATSNAAQATSATSTSSASNGQADIPKDEVGWFFVEQYYTTLSRNPEKLYLFYNKRSQFVSGQETDKVQVCVGQRAINDKIKEQDFQDCKVRVTNVDSQSSDSNIVIQVVGEISNKSQPHKKFVQTFVLAAQTNGYFVLNDIFRYLVEEEDEFEAESGAQAGHTEDAPADHAGYQEAVATDEEPKTLTSSTDPAAIESAAKKVDKELEEKLLKERPVAVPAPIPDADEAPAATEVSKAEAASLLDVPSTTATERPATGTFDLDPEKPKDPEPTPVTSPPMKTAAPATVTAPKPAVPAAPKTWANLAAAAAKVATPATPVMPASAGSSVPTQQPSTSPSAKPSVAASGAEATTAAPVAPAAQRAEAPNSDSPDEWTAVGGNHARQQSRQVNGAQPEAPQYRGYVKNVFEHVDAAELRSAIEKFGELAYFDVARQKNCAFVDFKTAEGYNKATSTPIELGDDKLFVEERRVRPGSTPFVPRGQFQGGRGGRGGAGQGQGGPRGGFQGNRGNYTPRGRGGASGQRGGRGAPQAS